MKVSKLYKLLEDAQELDKKYYYVVLDGVAPMPGYYWNSDICGYTPEGDYEKDLDGWTSEKFATWDALIADLDSECLLFPENGEPSVEDVENPDELPVKEIDGRKVIFQYSAERPETDGGDEDNPQYEEYYAYYPIQICIV